MKTILAAAAFLAVLLFGTVPSLGQNPTVNPPCSQHPPVSRDVVKKARDAGHGIRQQYMLDDSRPPGREVPPVYDSSGGDCPADFTPRGAAAAAVGALLYNGQIHCSAVLMTTTMIVTAGHCIQGFDWHKLEFVLGLDSHRPVQRSSIYWAGVHPGYDEDHFGIHDIAYAYLNNQMTEATPVDVEENTLSRMKNLSLLHVGYGIAGAQPGARRCVNIPISGRCDASFDYTTANMNTCNGDSGGGAFSGDGNKILLAGMTDWGDEACAQFGVDVDIGYYFDWIQGRKSQAPRNLAYARVEPSARKPLTESPDEVLAKLDTRYAEAKFNSLYRGRWITWDATVEDVEPLDEDEIVGTCTLIATAGKRTRLLLHHYSDGCAIAPHSSIRFTGRLARLGPSGLEVVLPEPVTAPPQR